MVVISSCEFSAGGKNPRVARLREAYERRRIGKEAKEGNPHRI